MIAFILLIIGGLNWGLYVFGWDVVKFLPTTIADIVYLLVALSAIVEIFAHKKMCRMCSKENMPMSTTV